MSCRVTKNTIKSFSTISKHYVQGEINASLKNFKNKQENCISFFQDTKVDFPVLQFIFDFSKL